MKELHDHFFRKAKEEGYLARAAYKLKEIDERKRIFRRGDRVLDCGAAPGSWMQVALEAVGPQGLVIGIDLKPITHRFGSPAAKTVVGDLLTMTSAEIFAAAGAKDPASRFDVVLSDMAPNTTGDRTIDHYGSMRLCEAVIERLPLLLRRGGHAVLKAFQGEAFPALLERTRALFDDARSFKPKSSRDESIEIFLVLHGWRGGVAARGPTASEGSPALPPSGSGGMTPARAPARPAPSAGWGRRDDGAPKAGPDQTEDPADS